MTDAKGPTKITWVAESGGLTLALDKSRLAYGVGGKGMSMTIARPGYSVPRSKLSYAEALFNLLMPVSKSDTPEDFASHPSLVDLAISEDIWAMFDPTAACRMIRPPDH